MLLQHIKYLQLADTRLLAAAKLLNIEAVIPIVIVEQECAQQRT